MAYPHPKIHITHAHPTDFPSLARILPLANTSNPIERFMFKKDTYRDSDEPPSVRWAMAYFQAARVSREPKIHILKAVPEGQENAVGVAIVRVYAGGKEGGAGGEGGMNDSGEGNDSEAEANAMLEPGFCGVYLGMWKETYEKMLGGKRHAYWSTLMILPSWQRHGIGSAVIEWAMTNLQLDTMPVWLCAQPDGYALYRKFGWRDVMNVDMRLDEWGGVNRGYGLHRTVCMLREPDGGEEGRRDKVED